MLIKLFADGSCLGNPGPGAWAFWIKADGPSHAKKAEIKKQGGEPFTTNNRMELTAVIEGLTLIHKKFPRAQKIEIYSDSSWVVKTMTDNWKRKKNLDLWAKLAPLLLEKKISWHWVKGHAGHKENEDCDRRALKEALKQQKIYRNMDDIKIKNPEEPLSLFGDTLE